MGRLILVIATLFFSLSLYAQTSATSQSQSDKYVDLEQQTEQRLQWIREQNRSVLNKLKTSPNYKAISQWIYKTHDNLEVLKEKKLKNGKSLLLVDRGLGKPTDLILKDQIQDKVLFSNFTLAKNNSFTFLKFHTSPDEKHAVMIFSEKGSIDRFWAWVIDLETGKTQGSQFQMTDVSVSWISNSQFIGTVESRQGGYAKYDLQGNKAEALQGYYNAEDVESWYSIYDDEGERLTNSQGEVFEFAPNSGSLAAVTDSHIYFSLEDRTTGFSAIRKAPRIPGSTLAFQDFIPENGLVIDAAKSFADVLVLAKHFGTRRVLEVWDWNGRLVKSVDIPLCCSVREIKEASSQKLDLILDSPLKKKVPVTYNIQTAAWSKDIEKLMMSSEKLELENRVVEVVSADGAKIPARMTFKKGLQPDGQRPVWIKSYGGFNISGYLDPYYDPLMLDFFERGGIFVGPALRGGNEFGRAWNAKKEKKIKTFEDLIATANYFVQSGWTQAKKIISEGGSNGGFTVAASAFLSPQSFGVVIPVNGVLDLLRKDIMDPEFSGWSYEYGNSQEPEAKAYLEPLSPVELAAKMASGPLFLIVNGRQDSRVNPAHSMKAKASLNEQQGVDGRFISINNSGHWNTNVIFQDLIGWRTQSIIWTTVYDHLGIVF